jgi:hypothetical protein
MRIVPALNVLPLIGIAALVLVAATGPTLAKKARASAYAETARSAHYYSARDWKRHRRAYAASHRLVRPHGYARVYYHRRIYPWDSYETDLLFDCLLNQPFVVCP